MSADETAVPDETRRALGERAGAGWETVRRKVDARLQSSGPYASRIATDDPSVWLTDRAVRGALVFAVDRIRVVEVADVVLDVAAGAEVTDLRIEVIGSYADDLPARAVNVREAATDVLTALLGDRGSALAQDAEIRWVDLISTS